MTYCPSCGVANRAGSRYCNDCGARLDAGNAPAESGSALPARRPALRAPEEDVLGRLRALMAPGISKAAAAEQKERPPDQIPAWLAELAEDADNDGDPPAVTATFQPPQPEQPRFRSPAQKSPLPEWLQGAETDLDPVEELDWAADLDFSDLPDWMRAEEPSLDTAANAAVDAFRDWLAANEGAPPVEPKLDEPEGAGLLSGVRGPIPVEPITALPHSLPRLPDEIERPAAVADATAAALTSATLSTSFAQVAAGPLAEPAPLVDTRHRPQLPVLSLALLLAVIVPLVLRLGLFNPPASRTVVDYLLTIEALAPESAVLVAFDYEGGVVADLEPAAAATLRHLNARGSHIVAVSTAPQGAALAQRLWPRVSVEGAGYGERFVNLGYLPGSELGLRSLLTQGFADQQEIVNHVPLRDLPIGRTVPGWESVALIVVVSSESSDVQRWVEQIGSQRPDLPLLAVTTAAAEPVLQPYVATGQLRGLLGGITAAAAYEQALGAPPTALRRLDALTIAAALFALVIVLGNLVTAGQRLRNRRRT